jgi:drug/metabolite transporter (DMT)-like permease
MTDLALALVLLAALLHAGWNALLKSGTDGLTTMTAMNGATILAMAPALLLLPLPAASAWPWLAGGVALHAVYRLLLIEGYRRGDLGQVYAIGRGSAPLLVALGAAFVADEWPRPLALAGIGLVSAGILATSRFRPSRLGAATLATALGVGLMIACYSIVDGTGARVSGHALAYIAWLEFCSAWPTILYYLVRRGPRWRIGAGETARAAAAGLVSVIGYGTVLWAMTLAPLAVVSALRETSVLFAVLIGHFALGEPLGARRLAAGGAICLGAALLALSR